jgi:hypothetical protein
MEKFTLTRPSLGFSVNLLQAPALNPHSFDKHAAHKSNNLAHHDLLTHILVWAMIRLVLLFNGELQYSLDFIG